MAVIKAAVIQIGSLDLARTIALVREHAIRTPQEIQ
jgi:hypothetical protein